MKKIIFPFLALLLFILAGCNGEQKQSTEAQKILINGAGASFPYPLYSRWIAEYGKMEKNIEINYQSIGSGAGIQQFSSRVIDFGGTDAPMSDEQLTKAPGKVLHIPMALGAVAVIYNVPEAKGQIKLSPDVLADIYLGKIQKWSDPRLKILNPQLALPDSAILVVHRSDGSGTTNIFTDYLSAVSPQWKEGVGKGTSVNWPVGVGSKGNEGISRQVLASPGAIGYVELTYALLNNLETAGLKNSAGLFVKPTIEGIMAAAASSASKMPEDLRISIVNAPGEIAYPIAGYTYILIYQEQINPAKGMALVKFLTWAIHEGDKTALELQYAPLPQEVKAKVDVALKSINL